MPDRRNPLEPIEPVTVESPQSERPSDPAPLPSMRQEPAGEIMRAEDAKSTTALPIPLQLEHGRFCDTCVVRDVCPNYKEAAGCSISEVALIDDPQKMNSAIDMLISLQYERVQQAALVERMQGGHYDPNVTKGFQDMIAMIKMRSEINQSKVTISASASGSGGVGLLAKLFGGKD